MFVIEAKFLLRAALGKCFCSFLVTGGGVIETFSLFQIQPKIWQEINSDKRNILEEILTGKWKCFNSSVVF